MAAQLDTSFGGHTEHCFPHYEANPNRGRDVSIPNRIHPDYTIKEKGKNVYGYDALSEDEEFEEPLSKKQIRAPIMKKVVDMHHPASTQVSQPTVNKSVPIVQGSQRDPSIDGSIPDIYTTLEVKWFRDSGRTDDQINRLGRRKITRKANRAKKRDGDDVIEISDNKGERTVSTTLMDSKFVGLTTLLTDSTKSKTKTMLTGQTPGTSSSRRQGQSTAVRAKVHSKSTTFQASIGWGKDVALFSQYNAYTSSLLLNVMAAQSLH
uniref:Uncharacterized protein n=1 Tax=Romanomermis culicivorax TaxID=13658 RepID=A0A915JCJ3_ROMCU